MVMNTKIKQILNIVSICVAIVILGFVADISIDRLLQYPLHSNGLVNCVLCLLVIFASFYVNVILHEAGHLIMGLLSHHRFVSFQIGDLTFVKEHDSLCLKKNHVAGIAGQCLMEPPALTDQRYHCVGFLLGGGLMNLCLCIILYLVSLLFSDNSAVTTVLVYLAGSTSLYVAVTGLFPMRLVSLMNDGYNAFLENDSGKLANYYILRFNAAMSKAERITDIDSEILTQVLNFDFSDLDSPCTANLCFNAAQCYMAKREYDSAKMCYERIAASKTVGILKSFSNCELAFLDILLQGENATPEKYMDVNAQSFQKKMKSNASVLREKYAYYLLYKKDEKKAAAIKQKFFKSVACAPVKAERHCEQQLFNEIETAASQKYNAIE